MPATCTSQLHPNYIPTTSQLFRTINNLLRSTALHYGLPNIYTYMISNGIPGSTYLGATSAELAPTSEWVTQLPTLACKIFVNYHCPKRAPLDPLLALLHPRQISYIPATRTSQLHPNYTPTTSQLFRRINNLLRRTALHYGLPITYTYMISNGIPGSTYLGATSAELAPTSEWVTQLPTLVCKIFVKYHCPKCAPLDPLLALLRPLAVHTFILPLQNRRFSA